MQEPLKFQSKAGAVYGHSSKGKRQSPVIDSDRLFWSPFVGIVGFGPQCFECVHSLAVYTCSFNSPVAACSASQLRTCCSLKPMDRAKKTFGRRDTSARGGSMLQRCGYTSCGHIYACVCLCQCLSVCLSAFPSLRISVCLDEWKSCGEVAESIPQAMPSAYMQSCEASRLHCERCD